MTDILDEVYLVQHAIMAYHEKCKIIAKHVRRAGLYIGDEEAIEQEDGTLLIRALVRRADGEAFYYMQIMVVPAHWWVRA